MELQRRYGDLKVSQLDFESGDADSNPIQIMVLSSWAYHFKTSHGADDCPLQSTLIRQPLDS